jgi:hypothetical protein
MAEDKADAALAEIYALPLGEFTAARNSAAKELAADGERSAAEAVRAARKPTIAAWALNQLRHREPARLKRFADAVAKLEAAQRSLIEKGDRSAFAQAGERHREALGALVAEAIDAAADAGAARNAALEEKLASTLNAATSDPEVLELLTAGRLDRERVPAAGLEALAGAASAGRGRAPARRKGAAKRKRLAGERKRARDAQAQVDGAEAAVEGAHDLEREAQKALRRAQTDLRDAKAKLAKATERVASLEAELGD